MRIAAFVLLLATGLVLQPATGFAEKPARLSEADWQRAVDAEMDKAVNAPHVSPESKASHQAAKAYFDSLCQVDLWLGTREAHVFFDQELKRQERILEAMQLAMKRQNATKN